MSPINCLRRMDSEEDMAAAKEKSKRVANLRLNVERSWSGNLAPKGKPLRSRTMEKHKIGPIPAPFGSAPTTPKLVRSSGMRRDWSFEDPRDAILHG
ncbi:hypothetical protein M569_10588 [Genlisea aurea]|uniref:Uncharacterized protein n=1 Tax=Genlisea aurea TaxID=192259 RepID=S8CHV2_9LAMI|nr:hypothetical protein M569_10588 [Genlisea aurea]